ncbi:MAG: uracil-DNA glycosylase [Peptococcaceae bacterium]|nr:uracil-DNA glycosylase [Peptococcaceae bacterium]
MLKELDKLYEEIARCRRCPLALARTNPVRDTGNPLTARVVFVGEAPGANEIKQGIPFAGEAGKKLNGYLAETGLTREDVYITNVVRCRPTADGGRKNRTPAREIPACGGWLNRELEIIGPKVVAALGNIALKWLCGKQYNIGECHGRLIRTGRFTLYPMYHPAAAIYKKELDGLIRAEFRELGRFLGRMGE